MPSIASADYKNRLSEILETAAIALGSQRQLAQVLGVSNTQVSNWIGQVYQHELEGEKLVRLARYLNRKDRVGYWDSNELSIYLRNGLLPRSASTPEPPENIDEYLAKASISDLWNLIQRSVRRIQELTGPQVRFPLAGQWLQAELHQRRLSQNDFCQLLRSSTPRISKNRAHGILVGNIRPTDGEARTILSLLHQSLKQQEIDEVEAFFFLYTDSEENES